MVRHDTQVSLIGGVRVFAAEVQCSCVQGPLVMEFDSVSLEVQCSCVHSMVGEMVAGTLVVIGTDKLGTLDCIPYIEILGAQEGIANR